MCIRLFNNKDCANGQRSRGNGRGCAILSQLDARGGGGEGTEAGGQPRRNRGTHSMDEGGERKLDDASSFQDGWLTLIQGFPSIDKGLNKH